MAQFDLDSADGIQQVEPTRQGMDAFGRQRVSSNSTITSIHFAYSAQTLLVNNKVTGAGTSAHNFATSSLRQTVTTASGDSVISQTRKYTRYSPGSSYIFTIAANIGAKKTNVVKRLGAFDDLNGCFFEQDGTNLKVVTRTNASGSAVDTAVNQSSWNLDRLDGTGPSGITLDTTKHNLFVIDYVWHGVGPVRFGLHYAGKIIYCHQFIVGNQLTSPFSRTPIVPIRSEIRNTGVAASPTTLDVVCMTCAMESGEVDVLPTYYFAASNGQTPKAVSQTLIPIISIRPKLLIGSMVNRVPTLLSQIDVLTVAAFMDYYIVLNPTLTGANFISAGTYSSTEYDISATSYTGGEVLYASYAAATGKSGSNVNDLEDDLILGLNIDGTTADILTVVARASSNNNATYTSLIWKEYK